MLGLPVAQETVLLCVLLSVSTFIRPSNHSQSYTALAPLCETGFGIFNQQTRFEIQTLSSELNQYPPARGASLAISCRSRGALATKIYFFGSTISEPPICAGCNWQKYGNTPALSATKVIVLGVPCVTTSAML